MPRILSSGVGTPTYAPTMTSIGRSAATAWAGWVDSAVRPRVAVARLVPVAGRGVLTALLVPTVMMGALPVLFVVIITPALIQVFGWK